MNYSFKIKYEICEHRGVSATRNTLLDLATAEYVMFCDCDDMFFSANGIWTIFNEIEASHFDTFASAFVEQIKRDDGTFAFIERGKDKADGIDTTFVHGKVHRLEFLRENDIRWNDTLTVHEDSYFNCLVRSVAGKVRYCPTAFYMWRWRDDSVCRNDKQYLLKTYPEMIKSIDCLAEELISRGIEKDAKFQLLNLMYVVYFLLHKPEWQIVENRKYRDALSLAVAKLYAKYQQQIMAVEPKMSMDLYKSARNNAFKDGLIYEINTFPQWINQLKGLLEKNGKICD